jgi:signal transduction histidine kinase
VKTGSLRLRLAAGGAVAIISALVIAAIGLNFLFERHVLRSLASDLDVHLRQILASIELNLSGQPQLQRDPTDPRFAEPLSGLYWQLSTDSGAVKRSRSLWDVTLPLPKDELASGDVHYHRVEGPGKAELLAIERTVLLTANNARTPVRIVVAADIAQITKARQAFMRDLIPSLALLATALAVAAWIQIGLGLRPLARVREGIAAIRAGKSELIEAAVPSEVGPLVQEINDLVAAQERDLGRARGRAADLAHGLKTPLSALASDVRALRARGEADIADRIEDIGEAMRRHIERELARVRIRGKRGFNVSAAASLKPLVDSLVAIQRRTPHGERLAFDIDVEGQTDVTMDKADLAEVLGNLLENASRHAKGKVRVSLADSGRVAIDDDGPGVPESLRDWVLKRGRRLDERPDGSGLGLAIVQEVLDAYDRRLVLEKSPLGGLRAVF